MPNDPQWLTTDISKVLIAPVPIDHLDRSPEMLERIIALHDVENAGRYIPRAFVPGGKKETLCNIFVSDVTHALGCGIPHNIRRTLRGPDGRLHTFDGWQSANDNLRWLRAGNEQWTRTTGEGAQKHADAGRPAVVACDGSGHGHIAILRPSRGKVGIWIAQAGARNYSEAALVHGFGSFVSEAEFFFHL